jgi:hypothetical protein
MRPISYIVVHLTEYIALSQLVHGDLFQLAEMSSIVMGEMK